LAGSQSEPPEGSGIGETRCPLAWTVGDDLSHYAHAPNNGRYGNQYDMSIDTRQKAIHSTGLQGYLLSLDVSLVRHTSNVEGMDVALPMF
jgi:hypothetical protein